MDSVAELRAITGGIYSLMYVVFVAFLSVYFTRKTDRPFLMFPIIFWIFGQPVLGAYYIIDLPWLPFDLQPTRILFLYLLGVFPFISQNNKTVSARFAQDYSKVYFEKYLVIFICVLIVALVLNRNAIETKRIMAIPLEPLTFLLLYFVLKKIISEKILSVLFQIIILMGVINAVIAFVQLVDPLFLRTGIPRLAFGSIYRSYGAFSSEYIFGGFQTISLFVAVSYMRSSWIKICLLLMLFSSIFITFHRMGLIILIISIIFYMHKFTKKGIDAPRMLLLVAFVISVLPAYTLFTSLGGQSQLVKERLLDNTVAGRFSQFILVIKEMPHYPFGLGSEENIIYQKIMIDHGHTKFEKGKDGKYHDVGLAVHNGFLSIGIMYGILAMLMFIMMLVSMWKYFYSRAHKENVITVIPLICVIVWTLANLSNGIIVFRAYNVLIIAILAGAFVGGYRKGIIKSGNNNQDVVQIPDSENKDAKNIFYAKKSDSRLINTIKPNK